MIKDTSFYSYFFASFYQQKKMNHYYQNTMNQGRNLIKLCILVVLFYRKSPNITLILRRKRTRMMGASSKKIYLNGFVVHFDRVSSTKFMSE